MLGLLKIIPTTYCQLLGVRLKRGLLQETGKESLLLFFILVSAILLRLYGLGFRDFNVDEAYSFILARDYSFGYVLSPMSPLNLVDRHPTLHYALCWVWLRTAYPLLQEIGLSMEVSFRSMATLFSVGSVLIAIYCGRKVAGGTGAIMAGLFMAFSSMSISLAQDARMYSMFELSGGCFLGSILHCQSENRLRNTSIVMLISSSWFLLLSHHVGIIFVLSGWVLLFIAHANWRGQLVIAAIVLTGIYAYWGIGFIAQLGREQTSGLIFSRGLIVPFTYFTFFAGETLVSIKDWLDLVPAAPWIVVSFFAITIGLLGSWNIGRQYPIGDRANTQATAWLAFIPILVMLLMSFYIHKLFLLVRYASAAIIPFVVLIAAGLVVWFHYRFTKIIGLCAIVAFITLNMAGLCNMYMLKLKPSTPWKAVSYYMDEVKPAAVAIYSGNMRLPLSLYYSGAPLIELPEQRIVSWEELVRIKPELDRPDSDIVLMLSHPRQYQDQYLRLFSDSGALQPMKSGFFDVELWLRRSAGRTQWRAR